MSDALKNGGIDQIKYDNYQKELVDAREESKRLTQAKKDLDAQFADGRVNDEQYREFQREMIITAAEVEKNKAALKKMGAEALELETTTQKLTQANKQFRQEMQMLSAKHDTAVAALGKEASVTQRLTLEKKILNKQIPLQRAETLRLKAEVERLTKAEGENSEAVKQKTLEFQQSKKTLLEYKKSLKDVEKELSGNSAALKEFGQKTTDAGKKIMPASLAVAGLGTAAFLMASDYEESLNKMQVVFGENATEIESWSKTTLDQFGIAGGSALEMVSLFGDMATGMQIPKHEAAEMSMNLVGLSGNLSSFKNISKDVAENALKGIFTGEGESLKSLGVIMNETTLKQFAMSQGIKTAYSEMSQAEQVQLRYKFVLDATKNSQDDFANTSEGAANSVRIANESIKELGTVFGQELLPLITPIIQELTEIIQELSNMDEGTKQFIVTIGLIIAVAGPLLMAIGGISSGLGAIGGVIETITTTVIPALSSALSFLSASVIPALSSALTFLAANPIVLVIAAVALLVAGFIYLWNTSEEFRNFFIEMGEDIAGAFTAVGDFFVDLFTEKIPGALQTMQDFFTGVFDALADIAKKPINGIIELLNGAIEGINFLIGGINSLTIDMPDWMPDWLGGGQTLTLFSIPEIPTIPLLAKGGILSEGQAIVAEAGPEMIQMLGGKAVVTPLSSGAKNTPAQGQTQGEQISYYYINVQGIKQLDEVVNWYTHRRQAARAAGGGVI